MKLTEEQAKTKWCPFARVAVPAGLVNRHSSAIRALFQKPGNERDREYYEAIERDCNCIASRCAAWRWADLPQRGNRTGNAFDVAEPDTPGRGHCGLAGKPDHA